MRVERRGGAAGVGSTGRFSSTGATPTMRGAATVDPLSEPVMRRTGDVAELLCAYPLLLDDQGRRDAQGE